MAQMMILDAALAAAAAGQAQGAAQVKDATAAETPQFGDVLSTATTALDLAMLFEMPGSGDAAPHGEDKAVQAVALENLAAGTAPKADAAEKAMEAIEELIPAGSTNDGETDSAEDKQPSESTSSNMLAVLMPALAIATQLAEAAQVAMVPEGAQMQAPASDEELPVILSSAAEPASAPDAAPASEAEAPTAEATPVAAEPFVEALDKAVSEALAAVTGDKPTTAKQAAEKPSAPEAPATGEQKVVEAAAAPAQMPEADTAPAANPKPTADAKPKTTLGKATKAEGAPATQRTLPAQARVETVQVQDSGKTRHASVKPTDEDKIAANPVAPDRGPMDATAPTGKADGTETTVNQQPKTAAEGAVAQAARPAVHAAAAPAVTPVAKEASSEHEAARTQVASEGRPTAIDTANALKADAPIGTADAPHMRSDAARADQERMIARIAETITQAEQSGRSTVRLRLYPPELGTVRVEVTSVRGAITARIETSTPEAHGAINSNLTALRSQLEDSGVNVRDVQVQHRGAAQFGLSDRESRQGGYQAPRHRTRSNRDEAVEAVEPAERFVETMTSGTINLLA